jgi:flagellar basal body P-ring formation protein FlgA
MKLLAFAIFFCAFAASAPAQLDKLLAPLPEAAAAQRDASNPAPKAGVLRGDDLLAVLEKQIAEHFPLSGELRLSFARPWQTIRLPAEDFDATITEYAGDGVSSSFSIRCKITSSGETVGEWQLALRAQLWREVWVAQTRLDRGSALDRSMLEARKIDALRDKQTFVSADVDPAAFDVAQSVAPGRALTRRDLVERPLIHKGDVVEVVAARGLLNVHMKALALDSGAAKALIKMRNLDSHKEFNAQVINENQVSVTF